MAVGVVAQAAGIDLRLREFLSLRNNLRHRRMVLGEPIGRAIAVGDLGAGEGEIRSRQRVQGHVVQDLLRVGFGGRRPWRNRRREAVGPGWWRIARLHGGRRESEGPERQSRCNSQIVYHHPTAFLKCRTSAAYYRAMRDVIGDNLLLYCTTSLAMW